MRSKNTPDPMNAPEASGGLPAIAQAVDAPLTRAAIFLVATLKPGTDNRATLRSFCGHLGRLSCIHSVRFAPEHGMRFLRRAICCSTSELSGWTYALSWPVRLWRV